MMTLGFGLADVVLSWLTRFFDNGILPLCSRWLSSFIPRLPLAPSWRTGDPIPGSPAMAGTEHEEDSALRQD